ncbi:unnamed protein product [Vitrella brassicaformis CCMP3155]|uniref:Protein kinase domain-containing protein n=1 Tax=Vitrella brassicaformis (strain CCMP3155) TaxID=1169540 RepID=A0A0G4ETR4_VITBC|nr:unnamed protein product [Vitrella brassicaformis CCMP3155]|eukprot:CEM01644.1 unnamed protein product [Vitrella brassicaformis CCMP3155]
MCRAAPGQLLHGYEVGWGGPCERGQVGENEARRIAEGALKGLNLLHTRGITHGDVSLRNIMKDRLR